jgi:diacylglycerol kinase (ATP)
VRVLIYQNPDAGHDGGLPPAFVQRLQQAGHAVDWTSIKQHRLSDPEIRAFDLVVAAGGDGSVGRTARQLVGSTVPIAVLPLGTANNLASILDSGKHDLVDRIAEWSIVPFDAATIEFDGNKDWFFEGYGMGVFAETAAKLTEERRTGPAESSREAELARDIEALLDQARTKRPIETEVRLGDKVFYAPLLMLEILNVGLLGPSVELAPGVDPSDGALDVVLVEESQRTLLTDYLAARKAARDAAPPFPAMRAKEIDVKLPPGTTTHLDGKTLKAPASGSVKIGIEHHAVRFLGGSTR